MPVKGFEPGTLQAGRALTYASPRGDFVSVEFEPLGHGSEGDLEWTVDVREDRLHLVKESPFCTKPPPDFEGMDTCTVGDGRLDIEIMPMRLALRGHAYVLRFGNVLREQGVDQQVFRDILASFRAR